MPEELTLFDISTLPHNHTLPNIEAGRRLLKTGHTKQDEARLLEWIVSRGEYGITDQEAQAHFNWTGDYERFRRWTLHKDSKIKAAGYRQIGRKKFTFYVSA